MGSPQDGSAGTDKIAGVPLMFGEEIADALLEQIADGRSLRSICREPGMPSKATVFRRLSVDPVFRDQYTRAREAQADSHADDIIEIADDGTNDWMEANRGDSVAWVTNGENIQRSRLRVQARQWTASKLSPRKYGDKIEVDAKHDVSDPLRELLASVAATGRRVSDDA